MATLDRKLARDLWHLRGQVIAVALVVASGVALLLMSLSTLTSLRATADAYYDRYRFAEVFANVKRAPERLVERIGEIPGVQTVETRIAAFTTLDVEGMAEPITGRLVSLRPHGEPLLNRPALRSGRLVEPGRDDEAVVHEPFAKAHGLEIGDGFKILLNGAKRRVRVVGIALSPEFVYAIAPGSLMPDDARFAIVWMDRKALAAAYDLEGAFNDVSLGLLRGADPAAVIDRLDILLERYGGTGAIARADQVSNWFLQNEFEQLRTQATILPGIFLAVAAFLTNTVLGRLIALERHEVSLMKAFGYSNLQVGWHYTKLALAMAGIGVVIGWAVGAGLGRYNTALYALNFHFPFLFYRPGGLEFALSAAVSMGSALFGAFWAVRNAVTMPPAEAMRPPAPDTFRNTTLPAGLARRLDNPTRIILRQILRSPVRSALTVTGVAMGLAVLITALQWSDAVYRLANTYFTQTLRQDITVGLHEARGARARLEFARMPGVLSAEAMRIVPAELSFGRKTHHGAVTALSEGATLQSISDVRGWTLPVPSGGVVLGTVLAKKLGVRIGDQITIEVLEGDRPKLNVTVSGEVQTDIDVPAYMSLAQLNQALGDPPSLTFVNLLVDPRREVELLAALKEVPSVSSVMIKRAALTKFHDTLGELILIFTTFFVGFCCALSIGVIYNAARVALSERGRDLATLRVLGFTRWEISYILLGEAAILMLVALPLGCAIGAALAWFMDESFASELFRIPFAVEPSTYGTASLIIIAASVIAGLLVRRRLDRLDLVAVLKTRE